MGLPSYKVAFEVSRTLPGMSATMIRETNHYVMVEFPPYPPATADRILNRYEELLQHGLRPVTSGPGPNGGMAVICEKL